MTDRARLQMLEERAVLWGADLRPSGQGRLKGQRRWMLPDEVRDLKRLRREIGETWDPATSEWRELIERGAERRVR